MACCLRSLLFGSQWHSRFEPQSPGGGGCTAHVIQQSASTPALIREHCAFILAQAGFVPSHHKLGGSISVNGEQVGPDRMRRISGFVHQEDVILSTMTVRQMTCVPHDLSITAA